VKQAAGYQYVNIDDCWAQKTRAANGQQVADTTRFSRGMKNLTDTLHGMSL
jgi:alpha-galactosidase